MKLTEIILDNFAPRNLRALWLQPKPNKTVAFKVFNNGVWMDTFEWQDLSGFLTREDAAATYQPIGDYALRSEIPSLAGYVTDESLAQTLLSYVTSDSLSSTLSDYLTLEDAQLGYQPKGDYALNSALTSGLAAKEDNFTVGTGLEMTPGRVLNVTLDTTVFKVVSALPDTPGAGDENKIFLVPAESAGPNNAYTEYLWINSAWEELGQYISEVDLTPYLKITDAQSTYATKTELTAHTGNTSNPHNVTKSQVGLGNVDNTSDDNKPVSTAQQTALNLKQNITDNSLETDSKTIVGAINEVNTKVNSIPDVFNQLAYGVEWTDSQTSPDLTRIGNPDFHKTLPIQSALRGCIGTKDGISYYLDADNWAYKEDGSAAVLDGTDGDICIEVPRFYLWSESENGTNRVWISTTRLVPYAMEVPHMLVTAEKCTVDRTELKFRSIVNTTAQFRGGNNNSSFDQYLDTDPCRTQLGKPASALSTATAHTYAEASGGELMSYDLYKAVFYWLFVIEYATFNSQKAYNGELTSEGYHQGGLGNGVTTINGNNWNYYNNSYPLTPCGFANDLGNGTGLKQMIVVTPVESGGGPTQTYDFQVPRWRGFTNPFGDIWTVVSGAYIVRTGADTTEFWRGTSVKWDNTDKTGKLFLGSLANANGYIAKFRLGNQADIVPEVSTGASSTTHMCDFYYSPDSSEGQYNQPRWLAFGGTADTGAAAGLGCFFCHYGASHSCANCGFRMVYRLD